MNLKTAFVVDPLSSLDASIDTSVGLMHAVQERGAEVWVTEAKLLEAVNGRARAVARRIELAPSQPVGAHRWSVADPWFTTSAPRHVWLDEMAAVFIRTEPPLDETFTTATLILDLIDPARTAMINDPRGIRVCSEHLYPLHFGDLIPPTLVTADPTSIRAFLLEHRVAVLKPVDGCGGRGVLRLDRHDPNLASLIETGDRQRRSAGHRAAVPPRGHGRKQAGVRGGWPTRRRGLPLSRRRRLPHRQSERRGAGHRS